MRVDGSVHFRPMQDRSFTSRMRGQIAGLACGCFGRRNVRYYHAANSNSTVTPTSQPQLPDIFISPPGRTVTVYRKQIPMQENPNYLRVRDSPSDRQTFTGNASQDLNSGRPVNRVFIAGNLIDQTADSDYLPPIGLPSPGSVSTAPFPLRPTNLIFKQRSLIEQPFSKTASLIATAHSSCPATPVTNSAVRTGLNEADLAFHALNPDAKRSLSSLLSLLSPEEVQPERKLLRMYSLHPEDKIGMGQCNEGGVYQARKKDNDAWSAAKTIGDKPAEQNELMMLKKLEHPNIAKLLEHGIDPKQRKYCVVMEYGGPNLKVQLEKLQERNPARGFPPDKIKLIMPQLLTVLDYLEKRRVIHGDIKLDNLLFDDNLKLKACDFGLSRYEGEEPPRLGTIIVDGEEKPALVLPLTYMPPELVLDLKAKKVDIWSAGCTLAELVTGKRLFDFQKEDILPLGMKDPELFTLIQNRIDCAAVEIESCLGCDFRELFTDMMQLDAEKRITASQALVYCCITQLKKTQDVQFSVTELSQYTPPVHARSPHLYINSPHLYINSPATSDSSDSDSFTSVCGYHPEAGPSTGRFLDPLIEVDTPKTGQTDKNTPQFTFDDPNPEPLSTRRDTTKGVINPTYGQFPELNK